MALSGSFNTTGYDGRYLVFSWSATQDTAKNQSTISWSLKGAGTANAGYYMAAPFSVVIAGEEVYKSSTRIKLWVDTVVASGKKTFTHNSEGEKSFKVSVKAAIYMDKYNCSGSDTFTLNPIPRKATIVSANNFTDEGLTTATKPTVKWSNPMGDKATIDVGIFWDKDNSLIPYETVSSSTTSHTFTLTDEIKEKIYTKLNDTAEKTVYYYVRTTLEDGTKYYSSISKKVSILNPEPTFEAVIDVDNVTKSLTSVTVDGEVITTNDIWIKGFTDVYYGFKDLEWTKGSSYYMCQALCGSLKEYGNYGVDEDDKPLGVLEDVKETLIGLYATNKRHYSTAATFQAKTLITYIDLTCKITNTKMEIVTDAEGNSSLKATLTIEGNLFTGSFNGKDDNSVLLGCYYKAEGDEKFTSFDGMPEISIDKSKNKYKATATVSGLNYQKEYTFKAEALDLLNAANGLNYVVSKEVKDIGKPIFDWSKDDFNFNIPMYYKGQKLIYEAGDSITIPEKMCFSGFISNGIKALLFTIPVAKPIFASGAKISGSVICRGVSAYIGGTTIENSAIDISTNDNGTPTNANLSSITPAITENAITIRIDYPSAITGLTMEKDNNTPITAIPRGSLTITFT